MITIVLTGSSGCRGRKLQQCMYPSDTSHKYAFYSSRSTANEPFRKPYTYIKYIVLKSMRRSSTCPLQQSLFPITYRCICTICPHVRMIFSMSHWTTSAESTAPAFSPPAHNEPKGPWYEQADKVFRFFGYIVDQVEATARQVPNMEEWLAPVTN